MGVYIYNLHAVKKVKGENVAVYVMGGRFPDYEVLTDAESVVNRDKTKSEVLKKHTYSSRCTWPNEGSVARQYLSYYITVFRRAKNIIQKYGDVKKAIFVSDKSPKTWKGRIPLYENRMFEEIKCDTPEFTACKYIGDINI